MTEALDPLIVVFDVNVYLDAARLTGEPYSAQALRDAVTSQHTRPVPHPDPKVDAARALMIAESGILARPQRLQVWTSDHINALVRHKAHQPDDPARYPEDKGLGWSAENAQNLLEDLVWEVVENSGGSSVGDLLHSEHSPPLDHEDGMVMATAKSAADGDVVLDRLLVTRDRSFREKCRDMAYPRVLHPSQFVQVVRKARQQAAMSSLRPPL